MTSEQLAECVEIFFGQASDALCYVYSQLSTPPAGDDWQLTGSLRGPSCSLSATLPATHPFAPLAPGDSLLARAVVPEPSFWTPEMPHVYQAEIKLMQGQREVASTSRPFGIRTLGCAGSKLIYGGKRWVLRGVRFDEVPATTNWNAWREGNTSILVDNPSDTLCAEASCAGVLLVARLRADQVGEIARLSRWPAVGVVVLPADANPAQGNRRHNLILAQQVDAVTKPATWAQAVVLDLQGNGMDDSTVPQHGLATLVLRSAISLSSVAAGRGECDRLQRDLAARGDWAGFIV
jgi:hypothetical protein